MEAIKTTIPGLVVFKLGVFRDNRGWFKENFNHAKVISAAREVLDEDEQGLKSLEEFSIVQNNISYSSSEVIRGMHAEPWEKFISIASGKVYGAWVDLRGGPNFGQVFQMELTPETAAAGSAQKVGQRQVFCSATPWRYRMCRLETVARPGWIV